MTTEEALKSLSTHGFVYEPWRTPDEVWMAVFTWLRSQPYLIDEFLETLDPVGDAYLIPRGLPIELIGSLDFLVELAEFLEGRCEKS